MYNKTVNLLRRLLLVLMAGSLSLSLSAQSESKVRGRVVDTGGEPLPGVLVTIVGSTRGVSTDENGNFEMDHVAPGARLAFEYLGMQEKIIRFEGKELLIVLEEKVNELDEVTVVAFAKQRKCCRLYFDHSAFGIKSAEQ